MKRFWMLLFASLCFSFVAQAQVKTITNADLEKYRLARLKNDPDDERERQRLGLPSRAEEEQARKRRAMETSKIAEQIRRREAEAQNYWQAQASELRSEIVAVEAQINYLRARIGEIPPPQTLYAVGYNPYFYSPNCCASFVGGIDGRGQIGGRVSFGRRPQISIGINDGRGVYRQRNEAVIAHNSLIRGNVVAGGYHRRGGFGYYGVLAAPFTLPTTQNLTREELLANLRALEQTRAGLYARYSILEDEARRAGVKLD